MGIPKSHPQRRRRCGNSGAHVSGRALASAASQVRSYQTELHQRVAEGKWLPALVRAQLELSHRLGAGWGDGVCVCVCASCLAQREGPARRRWESAGL